jgi:undecaprenyl-diphosphatase
VFSLLLFKKKRYTFLILTWAIVVSYSRIYLGVHYPLDVVFGAILGAFLAGLIYSIIKPKTEFN